MELINKLETLKKKLIKKQVLRYQNTPLAIVFTVEQLESFSNDIIIKMSEKQKSNDLDEKGIYNFFRQSFKYKCIDEIKKYNCQKRRKFLENTVLEDCSFCLEDNKSINNPLNFQNMKDSLDLAFSELKKKEKKKPLSKILSLVIKGFNGKEIQEELNISSSSLDRYKKEIINILEPLNLDDELIFNPNLKNNDLVIEESKKVEVLTYRMVKFKKNKKGTIASLYLHKEGKNVKVKSWSFDHTDLDKINKVIDNFNITPHLEKAGKISYV